MIIDFTTTKYVGNMIHHEREILRELAKSWNNLDTSYIENFLADDFIYESQWVLKPVAGKELFISYLQSKFKAIKSAMQKEQMSVSAELAIHPAMESKACIVLTQITGELIRKVSLIIKIEQEKIKRIDVCFIPDPDEAELSGEFPK